jgi:hypothetical protein
MEWNITDSYKDMSEEQFVIPEDWHDCPVCFVKPRLWIFDNGCFAKCKCDEMYGKSSASGIAIRQWMDNHNGSMAGYDSAHPDLRDNWNKVVFNRKRKIKIKKILN